MSNLSTRVRAYLDKKNGVKPQTVKVEIEVIDEDVEDLVQAWRDLYGNFRPLIKAGRIILIILAGLLVMWSIAIVDIQNDCWMNKECREWLKKHN